MRRRTPKRHGHVGTFATTDILAADPNLAKRDAMLIADGFRRNEKTPIYRRKDGSYSLRIVWRRRDEGMSVVWSQTVRYQGIQVREASA